MKFIDNLKTSVKLFGGFSVVVILMLIIAAVGYMGVNDLNNGMSSLYDNRTLPIQQVGAASTALYTLRGDLYKYVLISDQRSQTKIAIQTDQQAVNDQIKHIRPVIWG